MIENYRVCVIFEDVSQKMMQLRANTADTVTQYEDNKNGVFLIFPASSMCGRCVVCAPLTVALTASSCGVSEWKGSECCKHASEASRAKREKRKSIQLCDHWSKHVVFLHVLPSSVKKRVFCNPLGHRHYH